MVISKRESSDQNWKPRAPEYSSADFDSPWVLVHFWATWNLVDRKMDEVLAQLDLPNNIRVRSCNIDLEPEFATKSQVGNVPALALFSHRERVDTVIGLRDPEFLHGWLNRLMNESP